MSRLPSQTSLSRRALLSLTPATAPLTHIASLLVHARPDALVAVRSLAREFPGAEVHETPHAAKLAIVLESADDRGIGAAVTKLQDLPGVIAVSIVAHIAESEASLHEEHIGG